MAQTLARCIVTDFFFLSFLSSLLIFVSFVGLLRAGMFAHSGLHQVTTSGLRPVSPTLIRNFVISRRPCWLDVITPSLASDFNRLRNLVTSSARKYRSKNKTIMPVDRSVSATFGPTKSYSKGFALEHNSQIVPTFSPSVSIRLTDTCSLAPSVALASNPRTLCLASRGGLFHFPEPFVPPLMSNHDFISLQTKLPIMKNLTCLRSFLPSSLLFINQ